MWPGCRNCTGPASTIDGGFCGGDRCVGKGMAVQHEPYRTATKKKLTRAMIKARRKKGRR